MGCLQNFPNSIRCRSTHGLLACCPRLEGEVASLRAHLDSMQSVYMLNADKLHYNVRVLCESQPKQGWNSNYLAGVGL